MTPNSIRVAKILHDAFQNWPEIGEPTEEWIEEIVVMETGIAGLYRIIDQKNTQIRKLKRDCAHFKGLSGAVLN